MNKLEIVYLIVEGHWRQIAALEMGLDRVPCIRLDHLSDKQRREYAIRHNRTAELSAWDWDALEEELAGLEIEGVDLSGLKFTFDTPPIPDELDAEDDYNPESAIGVKLVFDSYTEYHRNEQKIKDFAEEIGAELSVVKA